MFNLKLRAPALCLILSLLAGTTTSAAGCDAQRRQDKGRSKSPTTKPKPAQPTPEEPLQREEEPVSDEIKILARGNYSAEMNEPFVAVARDAETYAVLREANAQLPEMSPDFFETHAVVAASLGQRRSGGYAVEITRAGQSSLRVGERAPAKDAIVTMALTSPSLVVSVPAGRDQPLDLMLDAAWQKRVRPYRLTGGELNVSGGFAGRQETFRLEGSISVLRAGKLATFLFDLKSAGGASRARLLRDAVTGLVAADGGVVRLERLTSSTLAGAIDSPFRASGKFMDGGGKLTLSFETITSPHVSDNFSGTGRLEAAATGPAPPKIKTTGEEPM